MTDQFVHDVLDEIANHPETGFRHIDRIGPHNLDHRTSWHLFEDDNADPSLDGEDVEPVFTRHEDGTVEITDRRVTP